jgi:WD40 repeat protein
VSRGVALADLGTGKRIGHLLVGSSLYCCFDAEGNLYAQHREPDGLFRPYRWSVKVKGDRYEIGKPEPIDFPRAAGLAVSVDGRFLAGGGSQNSAVLDRRTGKSLTLSRQHDVRVVAIHPKQPWVASFGFSSEGFRICDANTGEELHAAGKGGCGFGRFTPDGKYLIVRSNEEPGLAVWSMPDCKFVRYLGTPGAFAVSPDSRHVATAEFNGKVRLTRIADGALVARFDAPAEEYIADATFSADGRYLIGLNVDRNRQHIWDLWTIRRRLAEMKLDWEKEPPPDAPARSTPLQVKIANQEIAPPK